MTVLALAAVLAGASRAAAHPLGATTISQPVDGLVAGADRLFVLAGGEVRTLDALGRTLARCAAFAAPPRAERHPPVGARDTDEVLRAAGVPDDDSTPEAAEALEDEGLARHPSRLPLADVGVVPRRLAAGTSKVWIATSSGVFLGDETGCRTAGLDGRDLHGRPPLRADRIGRPRHAERRRGAGAGRYRQQQRRALPGTRHLGSPQDHLQPGRDRRPVPALRTADTRREIEALVIRLYFERRRLKAELAAADDLDMLPGSRRELRIAEVEAELYALTGGAFTRLARHRPIEGESLSEP
jgi:hypothetical protein